MTQSGDVLAGTEVESPGSERWKREAFHAPPKGE